MNQMGDAGSPYKRVAHGEETWEQALMSKGSYFMLVQMLGRLSTGQRQL